MSYDPDITKKFLTNCAEAGIELRIFDGRNVKDFAGFEDGTFEHVFVAFDEGHAAAGTDHELVRTLTDLIRAQRDTRIALHYEPWPAQGVAVSLADLKKALEPGGEELRGQVVEHHLIGMSA